MRAGIIEDRWLAGIMGVDVFRFGAKDVTADAVREHMHGRTAFYFSKVETDDVATTTALSRVGFFVADVNVTFSALPREIRGEPSAGIDVGGIPDGKKEDVLAIAHDSFRFTRFHLDPWVSKATADLVKKEWVRNYAEGKRGDHLFVASNGQPVGFLCALAQGEARVIELIGVARSAQRIGVARTMIARFAEHYAKASELMVGTQVANVPSIRMYESMGFRLKSSQYVLHLHVKDGKVAA